MDDFLGTSIQYSELQIKLLEKEHYENQVKYNDYLGINKLHALRPKLYHNIQQKIVDELINSGFLDSDYDEDTTETESTDTELSETSLEIKENNLNPSESPPIELMDDSKLNISPNSSTSNISVVDELEESNSESIIKYSEYSQYRKYIYRCIEYVFSDIKYLMILFILMLTMPHNIDRAHIDNDIQQFCGGGSRAGVRYHYETSISWTFAPYVADTTDSIINDEDDERTNDDNDDDDDDNDDNKNQCAKKEHILSFDIITNGARISHHEFKIGPSGLYNDGINNIETRMRIRNTAFPREISGLFMNIGGISSMRIFKETSVASVGQHFGRSHGLYALVMAFVGIAGYAASNNIDEIMSISISSQTST